MDGLCGDIHIVRSKVHIVLQADLSNAFHRSEMQGIHSRNINA